MTTTAPAHEKQPLAKVMLRRVLIAIAVMALILVPAVLLWWATGQPAATYAAMGTICGAVAVMAGGVRVGVITSVVVGLLAPLAVVAGLSPVTGAALMALMTLVIGRLSRFGLHKAALLVPVMVAWPMLTPIPWLPLGLVDTVNALLAKHDLTLAEAIEKASAAHSGASSAPGSSPLSPLMSDIMLKARLDTTYLLWMAAFFFLGSIVPVILVPLLMRRRAAAAAPKAPETHTRSESMVYTVVITVLAASATYFFLDHPKQIGGSFFIATILVLTQVGTDIQWKLTIQRVLGTIGGVLLMLGITALAGSESYVEMFGIPIPGRLYLIGIVFGMAAIIARFSPRQWIYYVLIAPATACLNAFSFSQADVLGKQRLGDNLVGAALVLLAALITLGATRIAERRGGAAVTGGAAAQA